MECPDCGYQADEAAVFCPNCRFRFRDSTDAGDEAGIMVPDTPVQEEVFEDFVAGIPRRFSEKDLRMLDVQLQQTAVLVVLIVSLFLYTLIGTIPFVPVTVAGVSLGVAGIICLAGGLIAGLLFFFLSRRSLAKFRYR